jgi:glycosyltransferase involved in cell wall biosynthesis
MNRGLSIIVTAFRSEKFIPECLESVYASMSLFEEPWEMLIGIDECPDTRRAVMGYPLGRASAAYYFPAHAGTYVVTNSLIRKAEYDSIVRFDSDDVMLPAFSRYLLCRKPSHAIMRFPYRDMVRPGQRRRRGPTANPVPYTCGVVCFSPGVWDVLGGYRPWRCAADADLLYRAGLADISIDKPEPHFGPALLRRHHRGSLTEQAKTGISSKLRNRYWAKTRENTDPHVAPIVAPSLRLV